jgi:hypothetical protein
LSAYQTRLESVTVQLKQKVIDMENAKQAAIKLREEKRIAQEKEEKEIREREEQNRLKQLAQISKEYTQIFTDIYKYWLGCLDRSSKGFSVIYKSEIVYLLNHR